MRAIKINPQFKNLQQPETIINHLQELTKPKEATPHAQILSQLLEEFIPVNFDKIANPHSIENFKLINKHFVVLSVENVLQIAEMGFMQKSRFYLLIQRYILERIR